MADTRRDFIKKASFLAGAAGLFTVMPESIQRAMAINAEPGSTYLDAEHIVFLMQENRSFDHCYGSLQGVRGFDDPRSLKLPGQNSVWLQSNKAGETYMPFPLDIKNSKATWMESLPHSWENQVDARNNGLMDGWLEAKKSGNPDYAHMPLTMGYYDRKDIPFYYALADAFTVCDQHFCSSLTGTSANRSYFWAGTIREEQNAQSRALVFNDEINYKDLTCTTFPERLEQLGISWKVYQNELSVPVGFEDEEDDWLSNFSDNNLEFYKKYNVWLHPAHMAWLPKRFEALTKEIAELEKQPATPEITRTLSRRRAELVKISTELKEHTPDKFDKLSDFEKSIHKKAFVTNVKDPNYHQLTTLSYDDKGTKREVKVPAGDTFYQFRQDVKNGQLPTVSWLTAPSNFSDHPTSPWYGAWYVSEALDILTQNPEVWKKTIFILTYDENDGYFDHVPPFVPPHINKPESGACSAGMDTDVEHVTKGEELKRGQRPSLQRESAIGLGFRVPLVVASPWTRGGWVNSQVFDHTSSLQFLETFLSHKTGKSVHEPNISDWRRTVCGDLTSIFRPYNGEKITYPKPLDQHKTVEDIHKAKFKNLPHDYRALTADEIKAGNNLTATLSGFPKQEKGQRKSCALPYRLNAAGQLNKQTGEFQIVLSSGDKAGSPFTAYGAVKKDNSREAAEHTARAWDFAVKPGDELLYKWPLNIFPDETYQLRVHGPNGFLRSFGGNKNDPQLKIEATYQQRDGKPTGDIGLRFVSMHDKPLNLVITDHAYNFNDREVTLQPNKTVDIELGLLGSGRWYDFSITTEGYPTFTRGYAGRVETGEHGITDPQIGA